MKVRFSLSSKEPGQEELTIRCRLLKPDGGQVHAILGPNLFPFDSAEYYWKTFHSYRYNDGSIFLDAPQPVLPILFFDLPATIEAVGGFG